MSLEFRGSNRGRLELLPMQNLRGRAILEIENPLVCCQVKHPKKQQCHPVNPQRELVAILRSLWQLLIGLLHCKD